MIRLCLDVNVWVGHFLNAALRPGSPGAVSQLVRVALSGTCRAGPVRLVISHAMLDTLEAVMRRLPILADGADRARDEIEASAFGTIMSEPPALILGGSAAYPLLDTEDAAVLNTALARRAGLLVTSNIGDFIRGTKARTNTQTLSLRDGVADVIHLSHPKQPGGIVIATPFRAAGWLLRNEPCPEGVVPVGN